MTARLEEEADLMAWAQQVVGERELSEGSEEGAQGQ